MDDTEPAVAAPVVNQAESVVQELFGTFLNEFSSNGLVRDYIEQIKVMRETKSNSIYIDFQHVIQFNPVLANAIEGQYTRFEPACKIALQNAVIREITNNEPLRGPNTNPDKEYWVHFYNLSEVLKLRELTSNRISRLTSFCATVTRTSEVRPELLFATFYCLDCNAVIENLEQVHRYTEPPKCSNPACANVTRWRLDFDTSKFVDWQKVRVQENSTEIPSGSMPRHIDVILRQAAVDKAKAGDKCIFFGTVIVVPDMSAWRLPGGGISLEGAHSRDNNQGNDEGLSGIKKTGVRALTYKLAFLATSVQSMTSGIKTINMRDEDDDEFLEEPVFFSENGQHQQNLQNHFFGEPQNENDIQNSTSMGSSGSKKSKSDAEVWTQFSPEEQEEIIKMRKEPQIYSKLARSIAPAIFGHDEVKKGILLMLFGGVHKRTAEGINLRGDINVCVVGDPSVAKSQFLKYVTTVVPRAVYTSGKASTAAGLTATVVKDPETAEFNIEAGALMLADSGICCIDEFDKMDSVDQVAIHEAMEQQTISIAKAGIHATLNARTSILAAANPIGGRYDKGRSLKANLTITPAIMSRFDLLFVVLDKNDEVTDTEIAKHIVSIHQHRDRAITPEYSQAQLQRYIRFARTIKPKFTPSSRRCIVNEYCRLRMSDQGKNNVSWRITVRQLESMIRLSEAVARAHLEPIITDAFVMEAARLLRLSIIKIYSDDLDLDVVTDIRPVPSDFPLFSQYERNMNSSENNLEQQSPDNEMDQVDSENHKPKSREGSTVHDEKESKKETKKVKMTHTEYSRLYQLITLVMRIHEDTNLTEPAISQNSLLEALVEDESASQNDNQYLTEYRTRSIAVLTRMIRDQAIRVVENPDPTQPGLRKLLLNESLPIGS